MTVFLLDLARFRRTKSATHYPIFYAFLHAPKYGRHAIMQQVSKATA